MSEDTNYEFEEFYAGLEHKRKLAGLPSPDEEGRIEGRAFAKTLEEIRNLPAAPDPGTGKRHDCRK